MWNIRRCIIKLVVILSLAIPVAMGVNTQSAQAKHKKIAAIAGLIIGGAIAHNHYKKHRKRHHHNYYTYGVNPYYYHVPRYHKRVYHKRHYHNYGRYYRLIHRGR